MTKKERAELIQKVLNELFPAPVIPLFYLDPYTLLIAVLLSAQTTDKQVNKITPILFTRAKSPEEMCKLDVAEIEKIIRPCGLAPRKAKAIHALSRILIEKYGGKLPMTLEELEELPGVGHKTASVVVTSLFHIPAFPVDTHILRSAMRWGLSKGKTAAAVERDLKKLFPKESWHLLHLQMIYFARSYCPARGHKSEECPICKLLF